MKPGSISVRGLGKEYWLGERERYLALRDVMTTSARRILSREPQAARERPKVWALRDVTLDIEAGSAVGVIGGNGAGKSTFLKILSRITSPTVGEASIHGRVGSLLEVGTGFHPELTGRENIFLNGAIMGMRKTEIARKFDDIVEFAEVARFIDTPVKRYSSGMYVRLAFAVAAHLEPEVLLVDEVLAVGDVAFQKKCLGKMSEVSQRGRTVLFVSHNMAAVSSLTETCAFFERGTLAAMGATKDVVEMYLQQSYSSADLMGAADLRDPALRARPRKPISRQVLFECIRLLNRRGQPAGWVFEREPFHIELELAAAEKVAILEIIASFQAADGTTIFSALSGKHEVELAAGRYRTSFAIDPNLLRPGTYQIGLYLKTGVPQDLVEPALTFSVEPTEDDPAYANRVGYVRADTEWKPLERIEKEGAK